MWIFPSIPRASFEEGPCTLEAPKKDCKMSRQKPGSTLESEDQLDPASKRWLVLASFNT